MKLNENCSKDSGDMEQTQIQRCDLDPLNVLKKIHVNWCLNRQTLVCISINFDNNGYIVEFYCYYPQ